MYTLVTDVSVDKTFDPQEIKIGGHGHTESLQIRSSQQLHTYRPPRFSFDRLADNRHRCRCLGLDESVEIRNVMHIFNKQSIDTGFLILERIGKCCLQNCPDAATISGGTRQRRDMNDTDDRAFFSKHHWSSKLR